MWVLLEAEITAGLLDIINHFWKTLRILNCMENEMKVGIKLTCSMESACICKFPKETEESLALLHITWKFREVGEVVVPKSVSPGEVVWTALKERSFPSLFSVRLWVMTFHTNFNLRNKQTKTYDGTWCMLISLKNLNSFATPNNAFYAWDFKKIPKSLTYIRHVYKTLEMMIISNYLISIPKLNMSNGIYSFNLIP